MELCASLAWNHEGPRFWKKFKDKSPVCCSFASCGLHANSSETSSWWFKHICCQKRKINVLVWPFSRKGKDRKYLRLCQPYNLYHKYSMLPLWYKSVLTPHANKRSPKAFRYPRSWAPRSTFEPWGVETSSLHNPAWPCLTQWSGGVTAPGVSWVESQKVELQDLVCPQMESQHVQTGFHFKNIWSTPLWSKWKWIQPWEGRWLDQSGTT